MSPLLPPSAAAFFGLALGAGVGFALRPVEEPPPPVEGARPVVVGEPLPGNCEGRRAALESERDRLQAELGAARAQQRIIDARRIQREGAPVPWPPDPDPLQQPDTARAHVEEAAIDAGGELLAEDCDEYPCVFSIALPDPVDDGSIPGDLMDPVLDALADRGWAEHERHWSSAISRDGRFVVSFALGSHDDEHLSSLRIQTRKDRLHESLLEEAE